nr:questin oxidase family protein [Streptomyces sp. ISL-66]
MQNESGVLDEALERLHASGPERLGRLTNHAPMVVEALASRGQSGAVHRWLDLYETKLEEFPTPVAPVTEANWRTALGDPRRAADWIAYFSRELADHAWQELLAVWWPRLLPGIYGGSTHPVLDLVEERYGKIDHLVYSLAAPRRTDPATGTVHHSVIKPLGGPYEAPALDFSGDAPKVGHVSLEPASDDERHATQQVMGGADWRLWVRALAGRDLLANGFTTVALTYIGSELTAPIYRNGTIGAAKEDLERTAGELDAELGTTGRAFTAVAGAAVTQASSAIPSIALYTAFLRTVLGDGFRTTSEQAADLWAQLTGAAPLVLDERGRIRLDGWELDAGVQHQVRELWADPEAGLERARGGADWFMGQIRELYGWGVDGVDYGRPTETTVAWPTGGAGA